jgi:hypothetical protein
MNDPLNDDLHQLGQAMTPNNGFVDRVMNRIDPPRSMMIYWAVGLAAMVLLTIGGVALLQRATPPVDADHLQLIGSTSEWETTARAITINGEVPAREISRQRFERMQWADSQNHTTFQRLVPREKVTFVTLTSY